MKRTGRKTGILVVTLLILACCRARVSDAEGIPRISGPERIEYRYRLRGEVRLIILWLGRDNVGGGHITISRWPGQTADSWREEIEVLFGSDSERVPKKINRWGYGREIAEWRQRETEALPRLLATEFQGIMRHSKEASLDEALATTKQAAAAGRFIYDGIVTRVSPDSTSSEVRYFAENEEFDYRRPERLLGKFQDSLDHMPPDKRGYLENKSGIYGTPYGFLTGLSQLIQQVLDGISQPSLTFAYNSKLFKLQVQNVRPVNPAQWLQEWKDGGAQNVTRMRFRCLNIGKKTQEEFELWVSGAGRLRAIPLRILYQPRWWLRLRMDVDLPNSRKGVK